MAQEPSSTLNPDSTNQPLQQLPLDSLPHRNWDVIIAGAGPAGATCSLFLAREGHHVLVVEREPFPRDKVCGDLLIADSIAMLKQTGLYGRVREMAHEIPAMEVYSPSGIRLEIPGTSLTLKRSCLDSLLMQTAQKESAAFAHGNVRQVKTNESTGRTDVNCAGQSKPIGARILVLATGSSVALAHRCGLVPDQQPSGIAMRCYLRSTHRQKNAIISYDKSILPGYGWILPMGRDSGGDWRYNVGCGTALPFAGNVRRRLEDTFDTFLQEFPLARRLAQQGEIVSPLRGGFLRCGLRHTRPVQRSNVLAIGEAIGTTYPFTGEGIGKAMESGKVAAEIVHDALGSGDMSRLKRYPCALEQELKPRYASYAKAERWLSHRWLSDLVARRITKSAFLQERLQQFISETSNPRALFGLVNLLRSYWK